MRVSYLLWFSLTAVAPVPGQAGMFGMWNSNTEEAKVEVEVFATADTTRNSSRTLHQMIHDERRFVLFNSRRLTGECIDACKGTEAPTIAPIVTASPTTGSPTKSPTDEPSKSPTDEPSKSPTGKPSKSPTDQPSKSPTDQPSKSPTDSRNLDCEKLENLGEGYSEATGSPHFSGCYPPVTIQKLSQYVIPGRDDSVAVFVGGDYIGKNAAEVEGNLVVLGNLSVETGGPSNFVSVGGGTHIHPNNGDNCIIVGGDISASRDVQVFNQKSAMNCNIVYMGSGSGIEHWKTNGVIVRDEFYNMSKYSDMKDVLSKKSLHWKTLESVGEVQLLDGTTTYACSNTDDIQVFNIGANEHKKINEIHTIKFSNSCEGKTILINVHGFGDIGINAAAMYFNGKLGYGEGGFSTCLTENILWNFPDATSVDLGNGKTSEFHGSILVRGDLKMTTSGHSGRTMVLGDILHNGSGSEFHSYQFNPPRALPDPDDICELPDGSDDSGSIDGEVIPTKAPIPNPTQSPTNNPKCVHIPQNDLASGIWGTNDFECEKCQKGRTGGAYDWWPCNKNPSICEGNCRFV